MKQVKMHEVIAVEGDKSKQSASILSEAITTFTKKANHLDGISKVYKPFDEDGTKIPAETVEIVTTVDDKIKYVFDSIEDSLNLMITKDEANSSGKVKAAIEVDGKSFGEFSVPTLLDLQKRINNIRVMIHQVPTLDPTKKWEADTNLGNGIYRSGPDISYRTEKQEIPVQLAEATPQHKAQVAMKTVDKQVGVYEVVRTSGRLSVSEKSQMLEKTDNLLYAIKTAIAKANTTEVEQSKVAKDFLDYILSK